MNISPNAERLAWLTGFTGSAGYAVVLTDKAVAMTHGIYEIQIRKQVDQTLYSIEDFTKCPIGDWLAANAKSGSVIGYDPRLMTRQQIEMIEKKTSESGIKLKPVTQNPIDAIWTDRPSAPLGQVELFPDNIAGATSLEKRQKLQKI